MCLVFLNATHAFENIVQWRVSMEEYWEKGMKNTNPSDRRITKKGHNIEKVFFFSFLIFWKIKIQVKMKMKENEKRQSQKRDGRWLSFLILKKMKFQKKSVHMLCTYTSEESLLIRVSPVVDTALKFRGQLDFGLISSFSFLKEIGRNFRESGWRV